jgi:putative holliday junction resolvase
MPDEAETPAAIRTPPDLILAFDFGRRRIGVACGDTVSRTAAPLGGVSVGSIGPHWETVDSLLRDWRPTMLVVGLPYNADGSEGAASVAARDFAGELAQRYGLPVALVDERYSSIEAGARLKGERQSGFRKRRVSKIDVDSAAACVILERWLTEKP